MTNKNTASQDADPSTINDEAVRWLAMLHEAPLTGAQREEFRAWLRRSPAHAAALRDLEQFWRDLPLADRIDAEPLTEQSLWRPSLRTIRHRPAIWGTLAASLVLAASLGLLLLSSQTPAPAAYTYETAQGEITTVRLHDGTEVTLSADTALTASFSEERRDVEMTRGAAYFDVAHDETRPFHVTLADTEVRVLGTAFELWRGPETTRVSVTRGRVAVSDLTPETGKDAADTRTLAAGDQLFADPSGHILEVRSFDPEDTLSWQRGRLVYVDLPLASVVADLNRYNAVPIRLEGEEVRKIRVTTAFRTDQTEQFLAGLAATEPVDIAKLGSETVISSQSSSR